MCCNASNRRERGRRASLFRATERAASDRILGALPALSAARPHVRLFAFVQCRCISIVGRRFPQSGLVWPLLYRDLVASWTEEDRPRNERAENDRGELGAR